MKPTPTVNAILARAEVLAAAHAARVAWCETCIETHWTAIEAKRLAQVAERMAQHNANGS